MNKSRSEKLRSTAYACLSVPVVSLGFTACGGSREETPESIAEQVTSSEIQFESERAREVLVKGHTGKSKAFKLGRLGSAKCVEFDFKKADTRYEMWACKKGRKGTITSANLESVTAVATETVRVVEDNRFKKLEDVTISVGAWRERNTNNWQIENRGISGGAFAEDMSASDKNFYVSAGINDLSEVTELAADMAEKL